VDIKLNKNDLYLGFIFFSTVFFIKYILIKPVYIVLFLFILWSLVNKKYTLNMTYVVVSYIFISYLIFHLIVFDSDYGVIFNAILSIFLFPIFYYFLDGRVNITQIKIFLNLSILYFLIEMLWRLSHPVYELNDIELVSDTGTGWYYPYKINSFIFTDSNYIALHIFCLICISLLARLRWQYFFLVLLMLLTFSRSGLLGAILSTLYFTMENSKYSKILKPIFYISLLIVFLYLIVNISLLTDGSFLSKFFIYDASINYAKANFLIENYFFGIGLSKTFDLINIGAHSIWIVLIFETGFLGLLIYFMYFSLFYSKFYINSRRERVNLLFFILVFLLMGFSLALYLFPIMVLTIAFIIHLSDKKYVGK